jgi:hypothetical protein
MGIICEEVSLKIILLFHKVVVIFVKENWSNKTETLPIYDILNTTFLNSLFMSIWKPN